VPTRLILLLADAVWGNSVALGGKDLQRSAPKALDASVSPPQKWGLKFGLSFSNRTFGSELS
jgi:hypothetical protein